MQTRAVGKAVPTHMLEPCLWSTELIKMASDPLLIIFPVHQPFLERKSDTPIIFHWLRRRRADFARLHILFGIVLLADDIMSTRHGLIDQTGLRGCVGEIEDDTLGLVQDRLRHHPAELRRAVPKH